MEPLLDSDDLGKCAKLNVAALEEPVLDLKTVAEFYDKWAPKYQEQITVGYHGPAALADVVYRHLSDKSDTLFLDVGCGTGMVAEELAKNGFKNIDGLDASQEMVRIATEKSLYNQIYECFLNEKVDCLPSGMYDAVVGAGVMITNHIPLGSCSELLRCLKPGGYFFFSVSLKYGNVSIQSEMNRLESEGQCRFVENCPVEDVFFGEKGNVFVYVKTNKK